MLRIGICEDAPNELERHKKILQKIIFKLSNNVRLYCFLSGEDLLFEIDESGNMDIILLDIVMLGMSGLEAARELRKKDPRAILIFISAHDQYCKELIDVQPYAYIDKPVTEEKLEEVLCNAIRTKIDLTESYCFSHRKVQYNIPLSEIRFFQSDKRLIYVNTIHKSTLTPNYVFYDKLEKVEDIVSRSNIKFLRVRKSFLVNSQFITEYAAEKIVLDNGRVIEISKRYKETIREHYLSMLKEKKWV